MSVKRERIRNGIGEKEEFITWFLFVVLGKKGAFWNIIKKVYIRNGGSSSEVKRRKIKITTKVIERISLEKNTRG